MLVRRDVTVVTSFTWNVDITIRGISLLFIIYLFEYFQFQLNFKAQGCVLIVIAITKHTVCRTLKPQSDLNKVS